MYLATSALRLVDMQPLFISEPDVSDPRPGLRGESTWQFMRRSTWDRAREIRAFYNTALAALPAASRQPILDALRARKTESALLEMVVGRFLQLRGASALDHEPESGGRHVDWRATFPDGLLHVEAMVPVYNAASGELVRRHDRLLDVIEERVPAGWWIMPFHLPSLSGHARLTPFRKVADDLIAQLPPSESVTEGTTLRLHGRIPEGRVEFTATRTGRGGGLGSGAMIAHYDDSERVIRAAWNNRRKRSQGRSVPAPALLAIAGSFLGADLDDFENALYGRDPRRPDGAMATDLRPPWAGVLAFPTVSPAGVPDPVLFVAPLYAGAFPIAIERLEVRRLTATGVTVQLSRDRDVMAGVRWARP
jgi:hypothetical protein